MTETEKEQPKPFERLVSGFTGDKGKPKGSKPLMAVLEDIQGGKFKAKIEALRKILATRTTENTKEIDKEYTEQKKNLPSVTFSGAWEYREKAQPIKAMSGFVTLDIDHVGENLSKIKTQLIGDPHTACVFDSPSGEGCKALFLATLTGNPDEYERTWAAIRDYLAGKYEISLDKSGKDITRLCFVSHDPNLFINPKPELFPVPKEQPKPEPKETPAAKVLTKSGDLAVEIYAKKALEGAYTKISEAPQGVKNPTLNSEAFSMGTLIGAGAIDRVTVENELFQAAKNTGYTNEHAINSILKSALDAGETKPRDLSKVGTATTDKKQNSEPEQEPEPNPALSLEASSCIRFFENEPKPREFIVKDFLPRLNVGVIAAPGGTGKGYFTLQLALSVATGVKFLGKFDIENPGGVLYCNSEDDEPEIHRRFLGCLKEVLRETGKEAAKEAVGALGERFYSPSLTGKHRLTLYPDKLGTNKRDLLNLARAIPDLRLIILDPANRIMAGDFNRVEEVTAFIQTLEEIATETGATILLVTHTNKASQTGDRDDKHSAGAVLGSQSFVNAARWVMTLSTFDESMRKKFQFSGSLESFISLRIPKANYLAPGLGELHLERVVDAADKTGLGSGPLRLVDLGKKGKEVTLEQVAQWVGENPGVSKTAVIEAIQGKFKTAQKITRLAVNEAIKIGFIKEEKDPVATNKKIIVPGFLIEKKDDEAQDDEAQNTDE